MYRDKVSKIFFVYDIFFLDKLYLDENILKQEFKLSYYTEQEWLKI